MRDEMRDPNKIVSERKNGSTRVQTINEEPTKTQQQFQEECDINNIMRKHGADPQAFQALTRKGGMYADFSNIKDYQSMLQQVQDAQDAFASLPAETRLKFNNNPGELLTFVQNKNNYDEGVKLGLVTPKPQKQEPQKTNEQTQTNDKKQQAQNKAPDQN